MDINSIIGRTVKRASWVVDDKGYQVLVIIFTNGTKLRAYENGQVGETLLHINGTPVQPEEDGTSVE